MNRTPDNVLAAAEAIINYNWERELRDYVYMRDELESPDDHIFSKLVTLNNWVHNYALSPDQYLEGYNP